MLITPNQLSSASAYNQRAEGVHWLRKDLPWPLKDLRANGPEFAQVVAIAQDIYGVSSDGKLGPGTAKAMGLPVPDPAQIDDRASNLLIVSGVHHAVPESLLSAGLRVRNFLDDGEFHFDAPHRTKPPVLLVIHESVTRSKETTVGILRGKSLGVHLMIAPDGIVSQHCDLVTEAPIHGNQSNRTSIGLEVVNPYEPRSSHGAPFDHQIPAEWWTYVRDGQPRKYVTPTERQIASLKALIPWISALIPSLPIAFPTRSLGPEHPRIEGWHDGALPGPGIVAHRDFWGHSDGRWPLEQLFSLA